MDGRKLQEDSDQRQKGRETQKKEGNPPNYETKPPRLLLLLHRAAAPRVALAVVGVLGHVFEERLQPRHHVLKGRARLGVRRPAVVD
jgi:hypothetical protein